MVTGGAHGIGRALSERFHREGASKVVVVDRDGEGAKQVAAAIGAEGAIAREVDVSREAEIAKLVEDVERDVGPIELFCSNAGIAGVRAESQDAVSPANENWQRAWEINVMAHVYAARALVPRMKSRGRGYFMNTVSAAGLLSQIGNPVYATTKHAAVGFAEVLALTHRDDGIKVSILCPQAVDTDMLRAGGRGPQHLDGVLTPEQVADVVVQGLADETFLILPHAQVLGYMRNKTENYDRWIGGMAKLRRQLIAGQR